MRIINVKDYDALSRKVAGMVAGQIRKKPDSVICFPTGATPLGMYKGLTKMNLDFSEITTFNLDEYVGLGRDDRESYHHYMFHNLFNHVNIKKENINMLNGQVKDLIKECEEYEAEVKQKGIDLLVLGIGVNGHIGMNEPGTSFSSETHVVKLSEETRKQNITYFGDKEMPSQAITMGIKTIMQAKEIILLASGKEKAKIIAELVKNGVTYDLPASVLNSHSNAILLLDGEAARNL